MRFNDNNEFSQEGFDESDFDEDMGNGAPDYPQDHDMLRNMELEYLNDKLFFEMRLALLAHAVQVASNSWFWRFRNFKSKNRVVMQYFRSFSKNFGLPLK